MTKLEKLRDQEADEHSSVYINNDIKIRAHVGFQCGWDARDKLAKEHTAKLVEALFKITLENPDATTWVNGPVNIIQHIAKQALADYKRMMEGEE